ncbi:MAG: hypothetical protein ACYCZB_15805 [Acidiphilium sp.]
MKKVYIDHAHDFAITDRGCARRRNYLRGSRDRYRGRFRRRPDAWSLGDGCRFSSRWHEAGSAADQRLYAAGTREILECFFEGRPIRPEYLIVDGGTLAGAGAHSYSAGASIESVDNIAKFEAKA